MTDYTLSDFYYDLPPELIAHYPLEVRSESRLLGLEAHTYNIIHRKFKDITELFKPHDLLILNNTKVLPARLYGEKSSGGKIEILVEKILDFHRALVHCRASKRPRLGSIITIENQFPAKIIADKDNLLELYFEGNMPIKDILLSQGHMPLPPYINRKDELLDHERYQTVYAKETGSAAAPTAGLHFDEALLAGLPTAYVTLHVGAGTFQTVRTENLDEHIMHSEYAAISEETCEKIREAKSRGGRIIAVGTTSVRTLETAAKSGEIQAFMGQTNLFIKPGFEFQCVDAMITNFHLPKSTLLMLVCAFGGYHPVMQAYQTAIREKYRFYSYGDAMFIG